MNVIYLFILLIWIPINISLRFSSCSPHTFNPATATHEHQTTRLFSHRKLRVSQRKKYEESALHHTTIILTNITYSPVYYTSHLHAVMISWSMHPFLSISLSTCVCVCSCIFQGWRSPGFPLLWCHTCESLLITHLVPVDSLPVIYSRHHIVAPQPLL